MINSKAKILAMSCLAAFALVGCAGFNSAYKGAPQIDLGQSQNTTSQIELSKWWQNLNDPILNQYIESALANNHDLAASFARIEEARFTLQSSGAALRPSGTLGGGASGQRLSENGIMPLSKIPGFDRDQVLFQTGFDASWELDVFGGVRHYLEAQSDRVQITQEETNGIKITIAAEVGRAYFELQGANRELQSERAYILSLDRSIIMLRERIAAGDLSNRDLEDFLARRQNYATRIPAIEARIRAANIALQVLQGRAPNDAIVNFNQNAPLLLNFPIGARSEILTRRPDIRAAERRLASATSLTAVQNIEKYPRFMIGAHAGWESTDLSKIFDASSQVVSLSPMIKWNIFDNGRIEANIHAAEQRQKQALESYSQSVISALGDASRAFSDYQASLQTIDARKTVFASQRNLVAHANLRFAAGDVSQFEILEAERGLIDLQTQEIKNQTQAAISQIGLFKALGGGWQD